MKTSSLLGVCIMMVVFGSSCRSGLVTMKNSCYRSVENGKAENKKGNYQAALGIFEDVLNTCKSYDAKEQGSVGKAAALNGLKRYDEALAIATEGFNYNNNSIDLLFERAMAELGLGLAADAKADLLDMASLISKNRNTAQRATIYAKVAEIDIRQKNFANAITNAKTAISLDRKNPVHYLLLGDAYSADDQLIDALEQYELAIQNGKDDAEAWKSKLTVIIKLTQKKYNTINADQLANKMSSAEKLALCDNISVGQHKGVKDMNIDLLQIAICK